MSTLTIFKNDIPVEHQAQGISELAKSLASSNSNASRRLVAQNGVFKRLVNGEEVGKLKADKLNVIIVNALPKVSRQFYAGAYDPKKEATLPDCWSNLGDVPDAKANNAQASSCATCPQNIAGSGGGTSRACRFQRRVAVILEGDNNGDVYQFNISSVSLFGKGEGNTHPFESYINYLIANNESPDRVVTEISFDDNASISTLLFTPVRHLTAEEQVVADNASRSPAAKNAVSFTVAAQDGAKRLPKAEAPAEEFAPAPAPAAKVEAAEEIDEPTKRPSIKPAVPSTEPKKNLADVVSAWSDEE